jgi:putative Holliday junction resolvase
MPNNLGRIIAVDYGKKRTGIAVSDSMRLIAGRLTALPSMEVIAFLEKYVAENSVDIVILGEPRQMDYRYSENRNRVVQFKKNLQKSIPGIEIEMVDERFTSVLAHRAMREGGLKKKDRQNKAMADELSAVILLQAYLEALRTERVR